MQQDDKTYSNDMAIYANLKQTAELCDCSERHINNLFKKYDAQGKVSRGKYDLNVFLPWYIKFLRENKETDTPDEKTAKERKEEAQAVKAEIEVLERQRKLIPIEIFEKESLQEMLLLKAQIYGVINRVTIKMLRAQTKDEVKQLLTKEFDDAFSKYADTDITTNVPNTRKRTRRKQTSVQKKAKGSGKAKTKAKDK